MPTATPIGSFHTMNIASGDRCWTSPSILVAHPPKYSNMNATSATSSRASPIGLPESSDSIRARRSCSRRTMSAARSRIRPRSRAGVPGHHVPSSNVRRAASIAASTSTAFESGAVAITSPVAGSNTSKRSPSRASTHAPSMWFCNASATVVPPGVVLNERSAYRGRTGSVFPGSVPQAPVPSHSPSVQAGSPSSSSMILPKFSSVWGSWTIAK